MTVQMSQAARDAIASSGVVSGRGSHTNRWVRTISIVYQLADPEWRAARDGERCNAGAGGRGRTRGVAGASASGCGEPAVVTHDGQRGTKPYRAGRCAVHAGGRVPLEDGRVIEPVANPLGGS